MFDSKNLRGNTGYHMIPPFLVGKLRKTNLLGNIEKNSSRCRWPNGFLICTGDSGSKDQPRSAAAKHHGKKLKLNKRARRLREVFEQLMSAKNLKLVEAVLIHVGWNDTNIWRNPPTPLSKKTITSITTCRTRIPGWQIFWGESYAKVTFPTEVLGEGLIFNLQFINWENGYLFITRQSLFPVHVLHIQTKRTQHESFMVQLIHKNSSFKFKAPKTNTSAHLQIDSGWALQIKWCDTMIHST